MRHVTIKADTAFTKGRIDDRIYGSFVEHMGRVVYTGIYEPSHKTADENGFRGDVLQKVRQMGVTAVRYPGGNFVSNYDWRDGIGPVEKRPRKRDLAWKSIETNEVGLDEFMKWADAAEVAPIYAVNLGTKGIEEALAVLEYCNMETGTYYSDLRAANGHEKPYGIRTWCLGNEMDGDWQIGHKTAEEYGRIAYETGKAMKILDPSIELVACGSSMSTNPTFGDWEQTVLEHCYPCLDYISLHQYYGGQEKGTAEFLAQSLDMERYIETVLNICDYVRVKKKMSHKINICFDEWGVWSMSDVQVQKSVEDAPWQTAPAISEQIYTMEDALLFASMLMNFIKRADRVKIACQSLLTNISSCIMTEKDGGVWVQPVYYPFALMAQYAHGVTLDTRYTGDIYACSTFETVPCVDHVLVYDGQKHEVTAFFVNRMEESAEVTVSLQGMETEAVLKSIALFHEDKKATNQKEHDCVTPVELENASCSGNEISVELVPLSFQMVQIRLK